MTPPSDKKVVSLSRERLRRDWLQRKMVLASQALRLRSIVPFSDREIGRFLADKAIKIFPNIASSTRRIGTTIILIGALYPVPSSAPSVIKLGALIWILGITSSAAVAFGSLLHEWKSKTSKK